MKETLRLFKALEITEKIHSTSSEEMLLETIRRGFVFSPEVCANYSESELFNMISIIEEELGLTPEKLNASFHKSWKKIKESSIEQLVLEQLVHYFTTYGFEELGIYEEESVYIPNERLKIPEIKEDIKLIVINGYTKEELKEKLIKILQSGIALKEDTIKDVISVASKVGMNDEEISLVKNKEAKMLLYNAFDLFPENAVEFLRFLIYKTTKSFLLIKDLSTIEAIKNSDKNHYTLFNRFIEKYGYKSLAEIFNRFKPLFLAFKNDKEINKIINKISKLSKKYHKPMTEDFLNNITLKLKKYEDIDLNELNKALEKVNVFRKIRLAYALNFRTKDTDSIMYKIRNGKSYSTDFSFKNQDGSKRILKIVVDSIIKDVNKNVEGKKIYIPEDLVYTLPSTEKQFTGDLPSGSYIKVPEDMVIGVHWDNLEEFRIDLDLKMISKDESFGWDASYRDGKSSILFSGDMTDAPKPNGASEMFYIKKQIERSYIISLNFYNYEENLNVPIKIFIAKEKINGSIQDYMVNPNNIVAVSKTNISKRQKVLGLLIVTKNECRFYFSESYLGISISSSENEYIKHSRDFLFNFYENAITLKSILEKSGAVFVKDPKDADIDLSIENLEKDKIIKLLY
jgi:hypothetical protein